MSATASAARAALTLSVAAMAVPTFLIGVLPGYDVLGLAAPLLLTLLRMVQGLSVGGEYTTSIIFLVEHARPERRGVVGAVADLGAVSGILLGSATGAVLEWADAGGGGGRLGLAHSLLDRPFRRRRRPGAAPRLRRGGDSARCAGSAPQRPPLLATFTHHWRVLVYLAGISVFGAVGFYLMFVYIVSWLQFADGIAPAQALTINTISMALLIPAEVGMAWLSDRVGRRPMLIAVTGLAVVAAWPLFWLMHGHEQWMILAGQLGFVVLVGGYYGCLPAFMVEAVPKEVRCTAIALGYNVSLGLIGGVSPLAATWLVQRTDNDYSPAFMIMAAAAISFLVLLLVRGKRET